MMPPLWRLSSFEINLETEVRVQRSMATILLIDDALFCRELVSKALRQEGYAPNEQSAERPIIVVATPRLDMLVYSNLGMFDPGSKELNGETTLFIAGDAVQNELPKNSARMYQRYPVSLHVLHGFLERNGTRQSAA
jgi:hypothetical protein